MCHALAPLKLIAYSAGSWKFLLIIIAQIGGGVLVRQDYKGQVEVMSWLMFQVSDMYRASSCQRHIIHAHTHVHAHASLCTCRWAVSALCRVKQTTLSGPFSRMFDVLSSASWRMQRIFVPSQLIPELSHCRCCSQVCTRQD